MPATVLSAVTLALLSSSLHQSGTLFTVKSKVLFGWPYKCKSYEAPVWNFKSTWFQNHLIWTRKVNHKRVRMLLHKWSKRGYTSFGYPCYVPDVDITIYIDVSINPGPQRERSLYEYNHFDCNSNVKGSCVCINSTTERITYERQNFLKLCRFCRKLTINTIVSLKKLGNPRHREKREGKKINLVAHNAINIESPVIRDYAMIW